MIRLQIYMFVDTLATLSSVCLRTNVCLRFGKQLYKYIVYLHSFFSLNNLFMHCLLLSK